MANRKDQITDDQMQGARLRIGSFLDELADAKARDDEETGGSILDDGVDVELGTMAWALYLDDEGWVGYQGQFEDTGSGFRSDPESEEMRLGRPSERDANRTRCCWNTSVCDRPTGKDRRALIRTVAKLQVEPQSLEI